MKRLIAKYDELLKAKGKNEKIAVLKKYSDDIYFTRSLNFLFDTNVTTGISKKKFDKIVIDPEENPIVKKSSNVILQDDFLDILAYLRENNTGKDENILYVKKRLYNTVPYVYDFISKFVIKDFKLGCDVKTINKAITNLVFQFNVQLGTSIEKVNLKGDEHIYISRNLYYCFISLSFRS